MVDPWLIIAQAVALVLGSLSALLAAKTAKYRKEAEKNEQQVEEKNDIIKRVGDKLDSYPIILRGMYLAETVYNGYNPDCGRCGEDTECSKEKHSATKKKYAIDYVKKELSKSGIPFIYKDVDAKIEELVFAFKADEAKEHEAGGRDTFQQRLKIGVSIERILERLVYGAGCSRAYIMEFHNGLSNFSGLGFLRMSCTYEICAPGIFSEIDGRSGMYAQMYIKGINTIMLKDYLKLDVRNPNEEDDTRIGYETLKSKNVIVNIRVKIVDLRGTVIGYLGVDFCKELEDEVVESCISKVKDAAIEAGALLSLDTKKFKQK
ncbi:MAG: hypothetical protein FWD58_03070 [Firmicutes bacterium]|nr:hypothetical protein [Bacillota bacterium]